MRRITVPRPLVALPFLPAVLSKTFKALCALKHTREQVLPTLPFWLNRNHTLLSPYAWHVLLNLTPIAHVPNAVTPPTHTTRPKQPPLHTSPSHICTACYTKNTPHLACFPRAIITPLTPCQVRPTTAAPSPRPHSPPACGQSATFPLDKTSNTA